MLQWGKRFPASSTLAIKIFDWADLLGRISHSEIAQGTGASFKF